MTKAVHVRCPPPMDLVVREEPGARKVIVSSTYKRESFHSIQSLTIGHSRPQPGIHLRVWSSYLPSHYASRIPAQMHQCRKHSKKNEERTRRSQMQHAAGGQRSVSRFSREEQCDSWWFGECTRAMIR